MIFKRSFCPERNVVAEVNAQGYVGCEDFVQACKQATWPALLWWIWTPWRMPVKLSINLFCSFGRLCFLLSFPVFLLGQVGFLKNAEVLFDFMRCCSPDMNRVEHDNCQCFGSGKNFRVSPPWGGPEMDLSWPFKTSTQKHTRHWVVLVCNNSLGLGECQSCRILPVGEKLESLELCQHQAFLRNDFRMLDVGGLVIKYELLPEGSFKKRGCVNAPSHPEEPPKMRGYFGLQAKINHTWRDCWTSSKMASLPSAFSVHAVSAPANWNRGCPDRRPVSSRDDPWRVSYPDASEVT